MMEDKIIMVVAIVLVVLLPFQFMAAGLFLAIYTLLEVCVVGVVSAYCGMLYLDNLRDVVGTYYYKNPNKSPSVIFDFIDLHYSKGYSHFDKLIALFYFSYFFLQWSFPYSFILSYFIAPLFLCLAYCVDVYHYKDLCNFLLKYKLSIPLRILDFNKQYRTRKLHSLCYMPCISIRSYMKQEDMEDIEFLLQTGVDINGSNYNINCMEVTTLDFVAHNVFHFFCWSKTDLCQRAQLERKGADLIIKRLLDVMYYLVFLGAKSSGNKAYFLGSEYGSGKVGDFYCYLAEKKMVNQAIIWAKYLTLDIDFSDKEDSVLQGQAFIVKQCMMTLMLCWHRVANNKTGSIAYLLSFFEPKKIFYPKPEKDVGEMIYYYALRSYGFPRDKCTKEITGVSFTC